MTDVGEHLARVLHDAVSEPPRELDPSAIRAGAAHRGRRWPRFLAPALAATAVAAVMIGVPLAAHQLPAQEGAGPRQAAVPSPPPGFTANEFRMAPPPQLVIGGPPLTRATTCTPQQISATAATRRTDGGVLGVIRLVGAVVTHWRGQAERCILPVTRGPSALIGAAGRHLEVPPSGGDRTSRPANPRPDLAFSYGKAIWGFAWLGSYCGAPARAIEIPLHHAGGPLRVPLTGPQPDCDPVIGASTLIDGVAGGLGEPVQPPRPEYSSLRLAGQIESGTTSNQIAPIDLTLRTTGSAPVTLDPCPGYAGRYDATARTGGFGGPVASGYLPCIRHAIVVRPGHPLHWTIPATATSQLPDPSFVAIPGSTVYVELGIAGVPQLRLTTTVSR